ncbi:uncharacterized protein LOC124657880 [Lolium rigidum]|uniref:uncharacterized protein LOC124657880 n=1 Tax=Lolium rigidum TaxID=89674 RepID=UPI001F5E3206|nr:uncharacterized protein LOC124657880 [Lolium rigidum]
MAAPADEPPPPLPADAIAEILSRLGDIVAVIRCAATCKDWRRLILEPSFLSHRRAGPSPLLGFFFRDTSQRLPRRRLYLRRPTRFLLLGPSQPPATTALHLSRFLPNAADLSGSAPVASGPGGLLALRRSPASWHGSTKIWVCDPMAGTSTLLPPLAPTHSSPESFVFLDADASSFRLLAAMEYPTAPYILMRVFCSRAGQWGTAVTAQLPDNMVLFLSSPAVVHRGAVHWICGTRALPNAVHALAVRPHETAEASVCRFDLPLRAGMHRLTHSPGAVRLSSSAQGCLSLVLLDEPVISIWNFQDNGTGGNSWVLHKTVYLMSVLPSTIFDVPSAERELSIEALCDQSSSLFLRAEDEGLFVLNLETEMVSKVGDDHCAKYLCPYVPDLSSCLGAMKNF